jgi:hypothetical protein
MRLGGRTQFFAGFGEGDVQDRLASTGSTPDELEGEGGLARAGDAFDQVRAVSTQTAVEDIVQAGHARADDIREIYSDA